MFDIMQDFVGTVTTHDPVTNILIQPQTPKNERLRELIRRVKNVAIVEVIEL